MRRSIGRLFLVLVLTGCRAVAPPVVAATPIAATPATTPMALPPGVVAEAKGEYGVVRVEERDGLRLMTIGGVVQGAMPIAGSPPADPIVELALAIDPAPKGVLLIGLGTGRTAMTFIARGVTPTVVEIEPAVVTLARSHFGYTGPCEIDDGLQYLGKTGGWDVVIVDAYTGGEPGPLFSAGALSLASQRGRVVIARRGGSPGDADVLRSLAQVGSHKALLGSGIGAERQTLYLVGSRSPFGITPGATLPLWPVTAPSQGRPVTLPGDGNAQAAEAGRRVVLTGYLIRLDGGALALDLPHWEMGAVRYLLSGGDAAMNELASVLPAKASFPTTGEIGSDGDTSKTLKSLLGGGDVMRSDTRFSPVVVTVDGVARFRAAVDPDLVFGGRLLEDRKTAAPEPQLPYGGVLYDLAVERVFWTVTHAEWKKVDANLGGIATNAARELRAGRLKSGRRLIDEYLAAFVRGAGEVAPTLASHREVVQLAASIDAGAEGFAIAVACDRAADFPATVPGGFANPHVERIRDALHDCAFSRYETALDGTMPDAELAAARLLGTYIDDPKRSAKIHAKIEMRFPGIQPLGDPPPVK